MEFAGSDGKMDDVVGDDALTWEALQSVGESDEDAAVAGLSAAHANAGVDGAANVHSALDADDHDAFTPLDELPSFEASTAPPTDGTADDPQPRRASTRSKRKNFSKHLQFLCLARYADHVRTNGTLPDRSACQLLLHQSFAQFVREGGSDTHPRLAYAEFLKLIRNRSAERQRRLRRQTRERTSGPPPEDAQQSSGKRKRVDEYEPKIDALIEEIDRVRRSRVAADHTSATGSIQPPPAPRELPTLRPTEVITTPASVVDTILRLQHETQRLQHELQELLTRVQDQCHQHELSSASV